MGYIRLYRGKDLIKKLELGRDKVTIGRTDNNTLMLADEGVSREHAAIEYKNGNYFITDLGSQNGVFLNNKKIESAKLKYWDEIQIHNFVIKFMAKQGNEKSSKQEESSVDVESDKTKFFNLTDEKQLDDLRKQTKECFLIYTDKSGVSQNHLIKKPRIIIGKSKNADIKISGWFVPAIAATIERQGNSYELIPGKRGKATYLNQKINKSIKLVDDSGFVVREVEFKFFNRLTKTS